MIKVIHRPTGQEKTLNQTHAKKLIDYSNMHGRGWEIVDNLDFKGVQMDGFRKDEPLEKPKEKSKKKKVSKRDAGAPAAAQSKKNEDTVTEGSISDS